MTIEEMSYAADEINEIALNILLPARTEKKIGEKDFEKFLSILKRIKENIVNSPIISRKLSGTLFFMYYSLANESQYCEPRSTFFMQVAQVEKYMVSIFGDREERKTL